MSVDRTAWVEQQKARIEKALDTSEPVPPVRAPKPEPPTPQPRRALRAIQPQQPKPAKPQRSVDFGLPTNSAARQAFIETNKDSKTFEQDLSQYDTRSAIRAKLKKKVNGERRCP